MGKNKTHPISFTIDGVDYTIDYSCNEHYRGGFNSDVLPTHDDKYVVKIFKRFKDPIRYERFNIEVSEATKIAEEKPGMIVPIRYSRLPEHEVIKRGKDRAFYVMEKCLAFDELKPVTRLKDYLDFLIQVAESLCAIHECGYAHRDVKVANVLLYGNRWVLSDYGCVFPYDADRMSGPGKIGPLGSPKELLYPDTTIPKERAVEVYQKSDSFLFCKLMWQSLVGEERPFEGPMGFFDSNFRNYLKHFEEKSWNRPALPLLEIMLDSLLYFDELDKRSDMTAILNRLKDYRAWALERPNQASIDGEMRRQHIMQLADRKRPEYLLFPRPSMDWLDKLFSELPQGTSLSIDDGSSNNMTFTYWFHHADGAEFVIESRIHFLSFSVTEVCVKNDGRETIIRALRQDDTRILLSSDSQRPLTPFDVSTSFSISFRSDGFEDHEQRSLHFRKTDFEI